MGDRANVIIKSGAEKVCLYTHWSGCELPETVRKALERGKTRWDDFQYLTRIIFCQMIPANDWSGLTGFGITCEIYDNEHPVIFVDCDNQTVKIGEGEEKSISSFVSQAEAVFD